MDFTPQTPREWRSLHTTRALQKELSFVDPDELFLIDQRIGVAEFFEVPSQIALPTLMHADFGLLQGSLTLEKLRIDEERWMQLLKRYHFNSFYVDFGVPEAFQRDRGFSRVIGIPEAPDEFLLIKGRRELDPDTFHPVISLQGNTVLTNVSLGATRVKMFMEEPQKSIEDFIQGLKRKAAVSLAIRGQIDQVD